MEILCWAGNRSFVYVNWLCFCTNCSSCCSLLAERRWSTWERATYIVTFYWTVAENPTRVLLKEIHSPAVLNNWNKSSTVMDRWERDGEGHVTAFNIQAFFNSFKTWQWTTTVCFSGTFKCMPRVVWCSRSGNQCCLTLLLKSLLLIIIPPKLGFRAHVLSVQLNIQNPLSYY